jgi:hypothetical protein
LAPPGTWRYTWYVLTGPFFHRGGHSFPDRRGIQFANSPRRGHLCTPDDDVSRDSAYALFRASGVAGRGDPGRFIREYRWERRDCRRNVLVSWSQVEFFELSAAARGSLYPSLPDWWAEVEVSTAMSVPLPPVLTYGGSGFIRGDPLHWAIFRSDWTLLDLGRWCADVRFRGIMWYLRPKLQDWIRQIIRLYEGASFSPVRLHNRPEAARYLLTLVTARSDRDTHTLSKFS